MFSNIGSVSGAIRQVFVGARNLASNIKTVLVAIFEFRVDIVTLRGLMPGDAGDIELLYVGRRLNLPHFKKKFFVEVETVASQKANLFSYRKKMKPAESRADVAFLDVGWPYNKRIIKQGEYLEVPDWISMIVPLDEDWDNVTKNFRKTMRKNIGRLIRRNEYRCEPTNDPDVITNFYDDLYVPFVNTRHVGEAFLTSRWLVEYRARQGVVLQVIGKDGLVSAGVYFEIKGVLYLLVAGMPTKHIDNPPEASISALYYFSLRYAFDNGLKAVNLLGTRSFSTDGVFQFKRKWGAKVEDSFSIDSFLFKPAKNNLKAAKFCEAFPMVTRKDGALELIVGATGEQFGEAECNKVLTAHHCEGFDTVKVVHLDEETTTAHAAQSSEHEHVRVVTCGLEDFSDCFQNDLVRPEKTLEGGAAKPLRPASEDMRLRGIEAES